MQPFRSWGSFFAGGLWGSIGAVASYLFGLALLQYILMTVAGFFGVVSTALAGLLVQAVSVAAPLVGTLLYIDWRWGWRADHIGLARTVRALILAVGGLALGLVAGALSLVVGALLSGTAFTLSMASPDPYTAIALLWVLLLSLVVELIFRGAATSRYQADLPHREALLAALLTPIAWQILQQLMGYPLPWTGFGPAAGFPADYTVGSGLWPYAMSFVLSLLFLRTDSVWFTAGIRFGTTAFLLLVPGGFGADKGSLAVWGVAAVALLALAWFNQQQLPRRGAPSRGQRVIRSRTVRGPWGPH